MRKKKKEILVLEHYVLVTFVLIGIASILSDVQRDGGDGGPGVSDFIGSLLLMGMQSFLNLLRRDGESLDED